MYTSSEIEGKSFFTLVDSKERHRIEQEFQKAQLKEELMHSECPLIRKDGSPIWVEVFAVPYKEDLGKEQKYVFAIRNISELKELEEKLRFLSIHDPLTGLYNRAYFEDALQRYESERFNPLGLIVADIDGLKAVNDSLGHLIGDKLIKKAAEFLSSNFRESDIVARIGGDEFAVLIPNCSEEGWNQIIARMTHLKPPSLEEGPTLHISFGYTYRLNSDRTLNELFKEADHMMYEGKRRKSKEKNRASLPPKA